MKQSHRPVRQILESRKVLRLELKSCDSAPLTPALHSGHGLLFTQQTFNMLFVSQCSAGY